MSSTDSNDSMDPLYITTRPLYGILTTWSSKAFGQRRLVKVHHSSFLTHRVLVSRLPPELIDQVAEALTALVMVDVLEHWETMSVRKYRRPSRDVKFGISDDGYYRSTAEKAAGTELAEKFDNSLLCTTVVVDNRKYFHISASENRPSLSEVVPGAASATGPALCYDGLQVKCKPGTSAAIASQKVKMWPAEKKVYKHVGRLVQVDGIEESIRRWDQEIVDRYVKFLGLKVVSINGEDGGGSTPRLRLLQTHEWKLSE
jgi:hypothetical protein